MATVLHSVRAAGHCTLFGVRSVLLSTAAAVVITVNAATVTTAVNIVTAVNVGCCG